MVVVRVINSSYFVGRDGVTKEDTQDLVLDGVGLGLVEGDEDKGVVHEVGVVQQGLKEVASPVTGDGDGGVVAIAGHVGGDEHPLGKSVVGEVDVELSQVLDLREALLALGNRVEDDGRVVLADIVVGASLLVDPRHTLETAVGLVFLVLGPRDALVLEEVNDGRHVGDDLVKVVVLHAKVITTDGGDVVGLTGVGHAMVSAQSDTLACEPGERCCHDGQFYYYYYYYRSCNGRAKLVTYDLRLPSRSRCSPTR